MAAASAASHDLVWMRQFIVELGPWDPRHKTVLFCDNDKVVVRISNSRVELTYRNIWMRIGD
jgi:hypothetical protein